MTDPTSASTHEPVSQAVFTNDNSILQRIGHTPRRMGFVFLALALGLASCNSNSSNGGAASGGATSSGGNSTAGSGTNTGGSTNSGANGGTVGPGTGGGSGGVTAATTGSGGKAGSGGSNSTGGESGGSAGSGGGGQTGSGAGGILGSGGTIGSGAGGATTGSGGATKSSAGGAGGSTTSGGGVAGSVGAGGGAGAVATGGHGGGAGGAGGGSAAGDAGSGSFTLTSTDMVDGAHFDAKFTCAASNGTFGSGVNPELDWSVGVPEGTKSFAITFIDTTLGDTNSMGQHWAIWNIPSTVTVFPQGTATLTGDLAAAKQSGKFLTPCAQSVVNNTDDQYEFTVYALSTATLNISGTTVANALTALKAITPLGTAKLHGHAGLKGK